MSQWVYNASAEVNDLSQYPTIIGVCVVLTTLMVAVVSLRIWVRSRIVKLMGVDDWIILFSMVCGIVYNILGIVQSRYGLGLPLNLRPQVNLNQYSTVNFAGRPFYMAGITGFKIALCFAYLRITSRSPSSSVLSYRNVIWLVMGFSFFSHLGGILVLLFQCNPVHKSWRPHTPGTCLRNDTTFYTLAALTIACDIIIFVLPIPLLSKLRIDIRRKVALIGIFALGLFTTVCSVMRMVQIKQIAKDGNSTMLVLWGAIEMNVGITLTCLPTLTPLLAHVREKTRVSTGRRQGYEKKGNKVDRKAVGSKEAINLSGYSRSALFGMGSFQTTITANEPIPTRESSNASSQQTIVGVDGGSMGKEIMCISTKSRGKVERSGNCVGRGSVGFITRTMEVSVHREERTDHEMGSTVPRY